MDAEHIAKQWGTANGYKGRVGGWIYDSKGKPVAQGWFDFWLKFRTRIIDILL